MTMNIILGFAFRIAIILLALSRSTSAKPRHLCHVAGANEASYSNYEFSISDLPSRCEAVFYGNYNFDFHYKGHSYMHKADEDAIRSLVLAKIPVYTYIGFADDREPWGEIVDSNDLILYNKRMSPLMEKINDLGISGVVLGISDIYSGTVDDYANKISAFMTNIKTEVPTLQFGLYISATDAYHKITNPKLFDFSVLNPVVDMYVIQMFTPKFKIKSHKRALTMEELCNAVSQSSMDTGKTYANVYISASEAAEAGNADDSYRSYKKIRHNLNTDKISKWCANYIQKLYAEGALVREHFYGISAAWLDYDDFRGHYRYQKYPATNALFDGFDGVTKAAGEKVDDLLSITNNLF